MFTFAYMKKITLLLLATIPLLSFSQKNDGVPERKNYFQAEYFYGNILKHQPTVAPLITGHPEGIILSWNQKNYGKEDWEQHYNYPDFGISFTYQDYKNEIIGKLYAIYGHYNFYLLDRKNKNQLILRTGIGFAYNTNPYDKETNNKNISFGTHLNSSTYFKLYYQRENIIQNIGLNAGLSFIHASNSNVKSPNTGINTWGATLGLNYNLSNETEPTFFTHPEKESYKEPIKYNFAFRGGVNESEIIGSGLHPFYVFSAYADKRIGRKSAFQLGTDVFISPFLKDYIEYYQINFPDDTSATKNDISRVSLFVGHELFLNKVSLITQVGYYVHYPFPYEARYYERLGLKRYFGDKWYAAVSLKAHAANAETVEFGVGIRL